MFFIDYIDAFYPAYCVPRSFPYCKTAIALLYARLLTHYPFWSAKIKWLSRIEDKMCIEAIDLEGTRVRLKHTSNFHNFLTKE